MDIFAIMGIGMLGFIAGNFLFSGVTRWLATVYEIVNDPTRAGSRGKGARIAVATFLGSGPWLVVVAIGSAYFIRGEPWAMPLFVGAAMAIALLASFSFLILRRSKRSGGKNAA